MTINWKQGLFAAALLLSASLLFVGCGKCKTDKAVADKSTGEIVGEEIDVIEVVPAQTPNDKTNADGEQKSEAPTKPIQSNKETPAMTPPATTPAPAADAPTTPEPAATPDATPSSTTSDVTVSTSCSETTSESDVTVGLESETVIESESAFCCGRCHAESACCPACTPAVEACQPACDATPACAPEPVCAPAPICSPAPACAPVCSPVCQPCCTPCRSHHLRCCRLSHCTCCRTRMRYIKDCSPCRAACTPVCVSTCMSACAPVCQSVGCSSGDCTGSWSNEQNIPADSTPNTTPPETRPNKTTGLPDPIINESAQRAKPSSPVGSAPKAPETPSIVLPETK